MRGVNVAHWAENSCIPKNPLNFFMARGTLLPIQIAPWSLMNFFDLESKICFIYPRLSGLALKKEYVARFN